MAITVAITRGLSIGNGCQQAKRTVSCPHPRHHSPSLRRKLISRPAPEIGSNIPRLKLLAMYFSGELRISAASSSRRRGAGSRFRWSPRWPGQRWTYFTGAIQWYGDLLGLAFFLFLLAGAINLSAGGGQLFRKLTPFLVAVVPVLVALGLLRERQTVARSATAAGGVPAWAPCSRLKICGTRPSSR
jgi:hypothetical protein